MKKFKRCCLQRSPEERLRSATSWSLHERSVHTIDALNYFFTGVGEGSRLSALRTYMTAERISEFYKAIATIWPPDIAFDAAIKSDGDALRGFFVGMVRPEVILRNVTRTALYADSVLLPVPFQSPWRLQDKYDPVIYPEQYRQDTHRWAFALLLLEPWIRSGLVTLVPDPAALDPALFDSFQHSALERERTGAIAESLKLSMPYAERIFKFDHFRAWLSMPTEELMRCFRDNGMTAEEEPGMREYVRQFREDDIFYLAGIVTGGGSLQVLSIPTIEETAYVCAAGNAFPFTDMPGKWHEILSMSNLSPEAQVWSPLSKGFSELRFDFLDGYDPRFAMEMRDDGRLDAFRGFLRKVWHSINGSPSLDAAEGHARELREQLTQEHRVASADWAAIRRRHEDAVRLSGRSAGFASVIGGIAGTVGGPVTGALGVAMPFVLHLMMSDSAKKTMKGEAEEFRLRVPMSVFIDLEERERTEVPSFVPVQ